MNRDQLFLLPPDMREWLPPDHPVHLVIPAVEDHLDTWRFMPGGRRRGGRGGVDPDMLVTVLVWAYAHGSPARGGSRAVPAPMWRSG